MNQGATTDDRQPEDYSVTPYRAVTADMLAIFGPGKRGAVETSSPAAFEEVSGNRFRAKVLVLASILLTGAIAAGTILGADVIGAQAPVAASHSRSRPVAPAPSPPAATPVAVAEAPPVAREERAAPLPVRPSPPAVEEKAQPIRITSRREYAPVPTTAPVPVDREPVVAARAQVPDRIVPTDLVETDAVAPVVVAERRAAQAYDIAATAGVRPRLLRGYRMELDRARGEAQARPRYAQRIFQMIAADLSQLADEAQGWAGGGER